MSEIVEIDFFLEHRNSLPVIDVRSPMEYNYAHIPQAENVPLFTDEQRAIIGIIYKKSGKEAAIEKALALVSPNLSNIVAQVKIIAKEEKKVLIHCWRGGMRSESVGWLLETVGFKPFILKGGYKSFRKFVLESFAKPYKLLVLGGYTGSQKTEILSQLKKKGHQVIDLEALAHHRGSAFGHINQLPQPSVEWFENELAVQLYQLSDNQPIWVEDESINIGKIGIPTSFYNQMREATVVFLDIPKSQRIEHLVNSYGTFPKNELSDSILRIQKRLGGLETKNALFALQHNDLHTVADILLSYYDKTYVNGLNKRPVEKIIKIQSTENLLNALENCYYNHNS